jgi:predicted hydrolase (HD superfamily)
VNAQAAACRLPAAGSIGSNGAVAIHRPVRDAKRRDRRAAQPKNHGAQAMAISREEAWRQLTEWTTNPSLLKHARAVEVAMRAADARYGDGTQADRWGVVGLLHDGDYEQWPDEHPQRIVDWLRARGEEEMAYSVAFHQTKWNLPPKTAMDKALLACDELAGFVTACCLVRPDGIASLRASSVKKKLKDKSFAAKVDREVIRQGIDLLGVDAGEHIQFVIDALAPHADELGIGAAGQ